MQGKTIKLKTDLLAHEQKAFDKLKKIKVGALYMEMGTGKTRTALEFATYRLEKGKIQDIVWLCPCSTKTNLKKEIIKHCGSLWDNIHICGIETLSTSVRENARLLKIVQTRDCFLIVDESNLVKNPATLRTINITRLAQHCPYRMILNGTPVSRNYADLYAQWFLLDWRILGYRSYWSFAANHIEYDRNNPKRIVRCLNVDYLTEKIAPYSYQIRKEECLSLPDKTYGTHYFDLTDAQYDHYLEIAEIMLFQVEELKPETIYRMFSALQSVTTGNEVIGVKKHLRSQPFFKDPMDNPRIQTLMDMIDGLSRKAIIYCKYQDEVETITRLINEKYGNGTAVPFYGAISNKKRAANQEQFEQSAQFFVAIKQCAGYGLNLQFCDYVIYYNNDWDYATRAQSEDRVHRIGQTNNVHIVDICADETIDKRILRSLGRKEGILEAFKDCMEALKDKEALFDWINGKD